MPARGKFDPAKQLWRLGVVHFNSVGDVFVDGACQTTAQCAVQLECARQPERFTGPGQYLACRLVQRFEVLDENINDCLLYTSDAADE